MNLKWFISSKVRGALAMHKHVWKLLSHQRDLLASKAVGEIEVAMGELKTAAAQTTDKGVLQKQMDNLEAVANKWLKPYPHSAIRENVEMLLVAMAVAMAIRTFFLQPFKIPTGSMQPTLFGVNSVNSQQQPDLQIPTGLARIKEGFQGNSYVHEVADEEGTFDGVKPPLRILIFNIKQTYWFAGKPHTIWFPPDCGSETLDQRAGIRPGQYFHKGEDIFKMRVQSGDYLFVNRLTYNFRTPERGDIVVFETGGIDRLPVDQQNTFYIKRLVGLGGDTLTISPDYEVLNVPRIGNVPVGHLVVNGRPLSAAEPHFDKLYSNAATTTGQVEYAPNHYYGHAMLQALASGSSFIVGTNNYFVMGDNTMNSSDSRYWGDFPKQKVIGKSSFVYWPLTKRFGWGNH